MDQEAVWPGKLILKGILDVEDARIAAKLGADAIVVSNHGGRQLDGAASSISMLPAIADAVGADIEVLFDGGIRTGADIMRALALGARGCLIGRAYVWGLGAAGKAGVAKAIDILKKELASRWRSPASTASPKSGRRSSPARRQEKNGAGEIQKLIFAFLRHAVGLIREVGR